MPQKLNVFYEKRQDCTLPPFLFAQRVLGARLDCFLFPSALCGDLVYSREFLLKSFVPGDFLTFICFYAAEVSKGISRCEFFFFFFPFKKKEKGRKKIIFLVNQAKPPKTTAFSTKEPTREKNKRALTLLSSASPADSQCKLFCDKSGLRNALGRKFEIFFFLMWWKYSVVLVVPSCTLATQYQTDLRAPILNLELHRS